MVSNAHRLSLRCPAKLNLGLEVLRRDEQRGLHELATVMQTLDLADRLEVEVDPEGDGAHVPDIEIGGPWAAEISTDGNTVLAAWAIMGGPVLFPALRLRLAKHIPAGAGLGGGSSDAAGLLLALREVARLLVHDAPAAGGEVHIHNSEARLSAAQRLGGLREVAAYDTYKLTELAQRVGSDVAFFLHGGCAEAGGCGERVTPLQRRLEFHAVLAVPAGLVSSGSAYAALGRDGSARAPLCLPLVVRGLAEKDWDLLAAGLVNDFEPYALARLPGLHGWLDLLRSHGARVASLTGSGSGFYGLFADPARAESARAALAAVAEPWRHLGVHQPLP